MKQDGSIRLCGIVADTDESWGRGGQQIGFGILVQAFLRNR